MPSAPGCGCGQRTVQSLESSRNKQRSWFWFPVNFVKRVYNSFRGWFGDDHQRALRVRVRSRGEVARDTRRARVAPPRRRAGERASSSDEPRGGRVRQAHHHLQPGGAPRVQRACVRPRALCSHFRAGPAQICARARMAPARPRRRARCSGRSCARTLTLPACAWRVTGPPATLDANCRGACTKSVRARSRPSERARARDEISHGLPHRRREQSQQARLYRRRVGPTPQACASSAARKHSAPVCIATDTPVPPSLATPTPRACCWAIDVLTSQSMPSRCVPTARRAHVRTRRQIETGA